MELFLTYLLSARKPAARFLQLVIFVVCGFSAALHGQGMAQGSTPPKGIKVIKCELRPLPRLEDVTDKAGIHFNHILAPQAKRSEERRVGKEC